MQGTHYTAQLLKKYIQGELSPAEEAELRKWAGGDAAYQRLLDRVRDGVSLQTLLQMRYELELQETADYVNVLEEDVLARLSNGKGTGGIKRLRRLLPYAAAVLVIAAVTIWGIWRPEVNLSQSSKVVGVAHTDIPPGGNRATLTLTDGRKIALSETQAGIVIGNHITYLDGSRVVETGERSATGNEPLRTKNDKIAYALLSTPEGGTYRITLPDGTTVWLNSASSLKYPIQFDARERVVELTGEAYFDVARRRDHMDTGDVPFKVVSVGQTVEVLGTEFNITAYTNEPETKTTLVKGVVQIINHESNLAKRLKPGEQTVNRDGNITVKRVDVTQFSAWKDGFFYFDEMEPGIAFSQLERWYGIDVVYQGRIPELGFFGMIDRNKPLSAVLKTLEKSGIKFKVEQTADKNRLIILDE